MIDSSASIYPQVDWRLQWDDSQNSYQKTNYGSSSQSHVDFKELYGLDLGDVEFTLVNSTPDITPPKVDSYAAGASLDDGILDLTKGEKLSYQFQLTDTAETNVASGFSSLQLNLRRTHSVDSSGNKVEVTNPSWDSDYIQFIYQTGITTHPFRGIHSRWIDSSRIVSICLRMMVITSLTVCGS